MAALPIVRLGKSRMGGLPTDFHWAENSDEPPSAKASIFLSNTVSVFAYYNSFFLSIFSFIRFFFCFFIFYNRIL